MSAIAAGFERDSSPEVITAACEVCAFYVSSGSNGIISINSRPIRLLLGLLSQFSESDEITNGRTPTSQIIVKLAVLKALAVIFVGNPENEVFDEISGLICKLWTKSIIEFAILASPTNSLIEPTATKNLYRMAIKENTFNVNFTNKAYQNSWYDLIVAVSLFLQSKMGFDTVFGDFGYSMESIAMILIGVNMQHMSLNTDSAGTRKIFKTMAELLNIPFIIKVTIKTVKCIEKGSLEEILRLMMFSNTPKFPTECVSIITTISQFIKNNVNISMNFEMVFKYTFIFLDEYFTSIYNDQIEINEDVNRHIDTLFAAIALQACCDDDISTDLRSKAVSNIFLFIQSCHN